MSEKIKVTNAPMQIWLQVGEVDETVDFGDLCLEEVAWEQEPIGATDIAYVRADAFPYMQVFTDLTMTKYHEEKTETKARREPWRMDGTAGTRLRRHDE